MKAFVDGYWATTSQAVSDARTQSYPKTMTGANLDRWAKALSLGRKLNESDASFLLRIKGAIQRRYGGVHMDAILEFVEAFLGANKGDITIAENLDTDGLTYKDAFYTISFDLSLLSSLGFPSSEFTATIAEIDSILDTVSAAGVKGKVKVAGGAVYDTGVYDTGAYGS